MRSGRCPAASSASAPAPTPTSTRPVLLDEPAQPAQVGDVVVAGGDDQHLRGRSGRPRCRAPRRPSSSSARSRRMNSMVLAANASSWWVEPRLGLDQRVGDGVGGLRDTFGEHLLPRVEHALVQAHPAPSLTACSTSAPDRVDQRDAGVDEDLGARGWGSARRSTGAAFTTAATSAATSASAVARSRSSWSSTAMSPGPEPAQQRLGVPVDPGDAGDPGQLGPGAMQQTGELHVRTVTPGGRYARARHAEDHRSVTVRPPGSACRRAWWLRGECSSHQLPDTRGATDAASARRSDRPRS